MDRMNNIVRVHSNDRLDDMGRIGRVVTISRKVGKTE